QTAGRRADGAQRARCHGGCDEGAARQANREGPESAAQALESRTGSEPRPDTASDSLIGSGPGGRGQCRPRGLSTLIRSGRGNGPVPAAEVEDRGRGNEGDDGAVQARGRETAARLGEGSHDPADGGEPERGTAGEDDGIGT